MCDVYKCSHSICLPLQLIDQMDQSPQDDQVGLEELENLQDKVSSHQHLVFFLSPNEEREKKEKKRKEKRTNTWPTLIPGTCWMASLALQ